MKPLGSTGRIARRPLLSMGKLSWAWLRCVLLLLILAPADAGEPRDAPVPGDDATYRPTLVVRKGAALGTGVIVASVEGETLILTAAHVVNEPGPLHVELFRYNLGWERSPSAAGFPRRLRATIAARDRDADLAILRVTGELEYPYVARIGRADQPIEAGAPVTSIGFDRGERLIGFPTQARRIDRVDMEQGGGPRSFLVTDNPPIVGRSGGGLFLADGTLIGICVARAQLTDGPVLGLYSTVGNIQHLLQTHQNLARTVSRSHPVIPSAAAGQPPQTRKPAAIHRTGDRLRAN